MDLYNNSPAAHATWEGADVHLLAVYWFSVVEIVKDNPKEKRSISAVSKGKPSTKLHVYDIRRDGQGRQHQDTAPFRRHQCSDTKVHIQPPSGLLFATQFAQIALVVTEKAAFEDMRMKGFVQKDCAFFGRVLGIGFHCGCPSDFSPCRRRFLPWDYNAARRGTRFRK
jgi:fatty acid synthase subunit alpha, fungi type